MATLQRVPHVAIVGAGFGGLTAARTLRRQPVRITVLDRRNHHLFQPLLYEVATAALAPSDIAWPIRSILSSQRNVHVLLEEALSADLDRKELVLQDRRLPYDYLIVATGLRNDYFGHPEWEPHAPGLKSLEDAIEIRRRMLLAFEMAEREADAVKRRDLLTFVIIGAGPTGVELSGAIAEIARRVMVSDFRQIDSREARVILIEAGPRVLSTYPEELSEKAAEALRARGVELVSNTLVAGIEHQCVIFQNGQRLRAATILWAAGVRGTSLAEKLGAPLTRNGKVVVAPDLSVPGRPEVFVIGDLAAVERKDGRPVPEVSPAANQEGRHAARMILRDLGRQPREAFSYFDKGLLAVIGRASAVAEFSGIKVTGFFAWLIWCFVHIFFLIGFRNRFIVMVEWAWAYFGGERGSRLIYGDIYQEGPHGPVVRKNGAA